MTTSSHAYALIMAGGSGTRFWPLSRSKRPKQLLPLAGGDRSLLATTVERIRPIIPPERVIIVTNDALAEATRDAVPDVPRANVLAEPIGRNTAPCVAWAAHVIRRLDPEATIAVLAADHFNVDEDRYRAVVTQALVAAGAGALVTCGIRPTRAETGYGYLEMGERVGGSDDLPVLRVSRFVEKPRRDKAEEFVAGGKHLWNSGQFFFRADAILAAVERHLPALATALASLSTATSLDEQTAIARAAYPTLPSISIDHGVMEKAEQVLVVPGDFGWSDVGSWTTAWELAERSEAGNAGPSDAVFIDAKNNYVGGTTQKIVALVGVDDLVVVDTEDALLVIPRERAQDVRLIVERLKVAGRTEVL